MIPRWWSQPFPPTGAITSEGIRNQLGRPPVDPLTVFVRETAQNSWDARLAGRPTEYRLDLSTIGASQRPAWERLFAPPRMVASHLGIGRVLRSPRLRVLTVVDRGTKGLGGPIRADEVADGPKDWASFILNVGEKRDRDQGGGTYGYGKAVLYRLSTIGTIIVHTRVVEPNGDRRSRLIGVALGPSFEASEGPGAEPRPFTGRHWWGAVRDGHVEPLLGGEADGIARSLGLPPFVGDDTGTTLVVVDPELDDFDGDLDVGMHLADTIAWHLWPLMLPERQERLAPSVAVAGSPVEVCDPASTYPLSLFVRAYRDLRDGKASDLECGNPRRLLGRFALREKVVLPMGKDAASRASAFAGIEGDPHHVCLMRSPELVVKYHPGPLPASTNQAYAGVFRANDDLDETFAASEPPTHDGWVFEQLSGREKTFVKTTFTRIKERLAPLKGVSIPAASQTSLPLGAASSFLGGLVAAAFARPGESVGGSSTAQRGSGAGSVRGGGAGSGRSQVRAALVGDPVVEELDGRVALVQEVRVAGEGRAELTCSLAVGTSVGREDEPPAGGLSPTVHSWRVPEWTVTGERCRVTAPATVHLVVRPIENTLTEISVTAEFEGGA